MKYNVVPGAFIYINILKNLVVSRSEVDRDFFVQEPLMDIYAK